jgi:uncharacterized membrane protein YvlD (DUF360 family)
MLIIVMFVLGLLIHWWLKSTASVTGAGPIASVGQWVLRNQRALLARSFLTTLFFIAWYRDPTIFNQVALIIAGHLTAGVLRSVLEGVSLPLNVLTAGAFGYFADSIFDKLVMRVPWLSRDLPATNGQSDSAAAGH